MNIFIGILFMLLLISILVLQYYPALGGKVSAEKRSTFQQSPNFKKAIFINQIPTSMHINMITMLGTLKEFIKGNPQGRPQKMIPVEVVSTAMLENFKDTKAIWFGHSTLLLAMEGKKIILDPMFSHSPSPFPLVGTKRYNEQLPLEIETLSTIDVVVISHDHYDHLDYDSIIKLKDKVKLFLVPLGVGSHLERWGIEKERIKEHDWWTESNVEGIRFVATPARHFSGRSVSDRNATLWSSWVIIGQNAKIYFSGDGGYGPHFKEIGNKYGPFDLTLLECGQYDKRWSTIHMIPEESAQAHLDLQGKVMFPIHWAAFSLALHDWTDPIERILQRGTEKKILITTPKIGEAVTVGAAAYPTSLWWKKQ